MYLKSNHYFKLKLQDSQNIYDLFDTTIKTVVMQQYAERIMQKTMVVACLLQLSLFY